MLGYVCLKSKDNIVFSDVYGRYFQIGKTYELINDGMFRCYHKVSDIQFGIFSDDKFILEVELMGDIVSTPVSLLSDKIKILSIKEKPLNLSSPNVYNYAHYSYDDKSNIIGVYNEYICEEDGKKYRKVLVDGKLKLESTQDELGNIIYCKVGDEIKELRIY